MPQVADRLRRVIAWLRPHWVFLAVLALGVVLRVITVLTYDQPFVLNDTLVYVHSALTLTPSSGRPSGYPLFMHLVPGWRGLWSLAVAQHVMGVLMALVLYVVMTARRVPRWAAGLATVPVLLDPYELSLEHYILTDVLFQTLIVLALALLASRRRLPISSCAIAGLLLGAAMIVRGQGDLLLVAVAVILVLGQARWSPALALCVAAALPIVAYSGWYHHHYGRYATANFPSHILYGRVAPFADCSTLSLPEDERSMCPSGRPRHRRRPDFYTWNANKSPFWQYQPTPGRARFDVGKAFAIRVIEQQPLAYSKAVLVDFASGFMPVRADTWSGGAVKKWAFAPSAKRPDVLRQLPGNHSNPRVSMWWARRLTTYSHVYLPGPVYAACLLIGVIAMVGVGRARRSGLRSATALFAVSAVVLLLTGAAVSHFSWRYQLSQFALLPPAAALGLTALLRREPDRAPLLGRDLFRALVPLHRLRRAPQAAGTVTEG